MQTLALFCCALFAGASVYINIVEHPARMSCGLEAAMNQWAPSYKRATWMQAPLAIVGSVCAFIAWLIGANGAWLTGAILLALVVPFTFVAIMPTNVRLLSSDMNRRPTEARLLLQRWNRLHAVRSVLSVAALATFLVLG